MKYRMHKRVETKPDGRKIYYYTFEPAQAQETTPDACGASTSRENIEPSPASASHEGRPALP
jgi:hypothetical protein